MAKLAVLLVFLLCSAAASVATARRPGVIIHAVGDAATAGDMATLSKASPSNRQAPHLSYRRYLYHMLTARGYSVRFIGSKSDCSTEGLDFDSHHDGYAGSKIGDIRNAISSARADITSSMTAAVASLQSEGVSSVTLIRVVMAGFQDAISGGRNSKDISDADLTSLVDTVESVTNNEVQATSKHTLVVPSPPPGGMRVQNGKLTELERDFTKDSRYEDYRFFLTWRGQFFDRRKNVADCFSYFDFLQHYNADGSRLNAYGDTALARCIFDNLVLRKYLPKPEKTRPLVACSGATAAHATRATPHLPPFAEQTDKEVAVTEAAAVSKALPPITTLVARAVAFVTPPAHFTCGGAVDSPQNNKRLQPADADSGNSAAAPAEGGEACAKTPDFPPYEPFQSTEKRLPEE